MVALFVHPATHEISLHEDHTTEEQDVPVNHDSEDCLQCVLIQLTGSEVHLSDTGSFLNLQNQFSSDVRAEIISVSDLTISLRAPPSIYV